IRSELARMHLAPAAADEHRIPVSALDERHELDRLLGRTRAYAGEIFFILDAADQVRVEAAWPHDVFVKTVLPQRVGVIVEIVDLPFPGDAGRVAGLAERTRENDLPRGIQPAAAVKRRVVMHREACPKRIATREQHRAARSANGVSVAMLEAHPGFGE